MNRLGISIEQLHIFLCLDYNYILFGMLELLISNYHFEGCIRSRRCN